MKTKKLIVTSLAILLAAAALFSVPRALETSAAGAEINVAARAAMLLDCDSGSVVYAQNETLRTPIASMVKIMTLDIAFDELEAGRLDCSEMISVSENASGMGGSQAFLRAYGKYDAGELLRSIVVASANDSCVAIAERIAGTVDAFVARMNDKAKALGMSDTVFVNCTGLPAEGQYSCAKDVAVMSRELFSHRKFFEYAGTWMYDFRHPDGATTLLTNTNKLIKSYTGCDGGKTGFTGEAMSCLSATAKRGNTRLISIVLGAADGKKRNAEISKLFDYGFANYETTVVAEKGGKVDTSVAVDGGKAKTVPVVYGADYKAFDKKTDGKKYSVRIETGMVKAPIAEGAEVGKAIIEHNGTIVAEIPLIAAANVEKKSFWEHVRDFF